MIQLLSKYKSYILTFLLIVGMIFAVNIFAAEPTRTLGFQGQFYAENTPGNAPVSATFTFYDSLTDGNITGTPITKIINVVNGYFGTQFTEADTTGVNLDQQLYLEISINGVTLSPRTTVNPTVSSLKSFGTFSYASAPAVGPSGSLYFNTTSQELYVSNGTSWQLSGFASSTTQWVANGTSLNYMAGNVGIGTTNPTNKLSFGGNSVISLDSLDDADVSSLGLTPSSWSGTGSIADRGSFIFMYGNEHATGSKGRILIGAGNVYESGTDGAIVFRTGNNAIRAVVDYFGNVGIGTTTPGARLTVYDSTVNSSGQKLLELSANYSSYGTANRGGYISFLNNNGSTLANEVSRIGSIVTTANRVGLVFSGYNGSTLNEYMRLDGNGNLGIGTTSPVGRFSVKGVGTGTGFLAQFTDSANAPKFTILDNGNVGIGTTAPVEMLHIAFATSTPVPTTAMSGTVGNGITIRNTDAAAQFAGIHFQVRSASQSSALIGLEYGSSSSDGSIFFRIRNGAGTSNESMRLLANGNVGIGTTTPGFKLTVDGSFIVASTTATSTFVGAVGIGNNPTTALGTLAIKPFTNQTQLFLQQDNSALGFGIWMDSATGQLKFVRAGANILTLGTNASSTSIFLTPLVVSGDLSANNITVNPGFKLNFSNGSEIKRITSDGHMQYLSQNGIHEIVGTIQTGSVTATSTTGTSTFAGSVGIGTLNPQFALQVNGHSSFPSLMFNADVANATDTQRAGMGWQATLQSNVLSALITATNTGNFGADLQFLTRAAVGGNLSEKLRITSTGNVGIGTTTPGYKLDVNGTVRLGADGAGAFRFSDASFAQYYQSEANPRFVYDRNISPIANSGSGALLFNPASIFGGATSSATGAGLTSAGVGALAFINGNGTSLVETMRILQNGNVGIGTTTPNAKLHILGTTEQFRLGYNTTNYVPFTVNSSGSLNIVPVGTVPYIMIGAGTTPESELSLTGVMSFTARVGSSTFVTGSNAKIYSTAAGGTYPFNQNNNLVIQPRTTGGSFDLIFATFDGSTVDSRMVVRANGNVGIGTTTASQILVASGTIQSTALLGGATTLSTDANGNIIRTPSDQKLKTNVETLTSALDKVNQMRGVSYNWIDTNRFGTSTEIGFIAQELETIVPEVVKSGGEYKSVNYQNLTALLTEAIKELSTKFTNLSEVVKTKFVDADKVDTNELCIKKPDGTKVCLTATQLEQLLLNQGTNNTVHSNPTPAPQTVEEVPPPQEEEIVPAPEAPAEASTETLVETPTE